MNLTTHTSAVSTTDAPTWADTLIHSRRTTLPKRLCGPGPDEHQQRLILEAAAAAPDHEQILPWRFVEIPSDRRAALGQAFVDALVERDPSAGEDDRAQARDKALRSPWLLLAVASAAIGYVGGARVSADLPGEQTVCWVLVLSLPLTLPATLLAWPAQPASASAWGGLLYVSLFSMWLGFFAWYRGLALGGVMRVSQIQLLQPFLALLFAVPILGERLDAVTLVFALAVVAVVFIGRRMPADLGKGRQRTN